MAKRSYLNDEQKSLLIDLVGQYPDLQSGKFTNKFSYKDAQNAWQSIADQLHEIPGAVKEWSKWRKTWQDLKAAAKSKKSAINIHQRGTGGGPAVDVILTDHDKNVLDLIGTTLVEGHPNVKESQAEWKWKADEELVQGIEYLEEDEKLMSCSSSSKYSYQYDDYVNRINARASNTVAQKKPFITTPTKTISRPLRINEGASTSAQHVVVQEALNTPRLSSFQKCLRRDQNMRRTNRPQNLKRAEIEQRFETSVQNSAQLLQISKDQLESQNNYFNQKLALYKKEIELKQRSVAAKEAIVDLLSQIAKKYKD